MTNLCAFLRKFVVMYSIIISVDLGIATAKQYSQKMKFAGRKISNKSISPATTAFVPSKQNRFRKNAQVRIPFAAQARCKPTKLANFGKPPIEIGRFMATLADENFIADEHNWREHPALTETLKIPTVIVPAKYLHPMISQGKEQGLLAPFVASHMRELTNIHPRVKLVQNLDKIDADLGDVCDVKSKKAILLDPNRVLNGRDTTIQAESGSQTENFDSLSKSFPQLNEEVLKSLASHSAEPGPMVPVSLTYKQQTIQNILGKILPEEAQPPPTGFEQIGHVVHLNLKSHHEPYRKLIGSVILDRLSPKIQSVVNKVGEVSGPYRTYEMDVLAGKSDTIVQVNEDGVTLEFDLRKVYWCTRLSGERKRLLEEFEQGQVVADAFCGAGAFVVQAATKRGCTVYANDLNPDAVRFCRENAERNLKRFNGSNEKKPKVDVTCGDAFDFIQNLGFMDTLPHHVVMNFPLDSSSFLGALRWWPTKDEREVVPTFHLYTFARGDDPENHNEENELPPRDAAEVAVDLVAEGLLPEGGAIEASKYRRSLLDRMGCDVKSREIRDVAPGKVVICVSFKATDVLLRTMQGDFVDF